MKANRYPAMYEAQWRRFFPRSNLPNSNEEYIAAVVDAACCLQKSFLELPSSNKKVRLLLLRGHLLQLQKRVSTEPSYKKLGAALATAYNLMDKAIRLSPFNVPILN